MKGGAGVPRPDNLRDLGCKRGSKEAGVGQVKRKGAAELGQVGIFQASEERGAGNETRYFGLPRQTLNPSQLISARILCEKLTDHGERGDSRVIE